MNFELNFSRKNLTQAPTSSLVGAAGGAAWAVYQLWQAGGSPTTVDGLAQTFGPAIFSAVVGGIIKVTRGNA